MATVTKPMVLDETHRLTSDQSKNIADVISEGLSNIALGNTSYTKAETDALIDALDYSDTAVSGSYVTEVDETDGVISVTRESADATPTDSSMKMVISGGVKTALDAKQDTLTAGDGIDITSDVVSVDAEEKTTTSTFSTVNGGLLSSCVVTLEPVQSGSGTPSPNNIRPITGHTEVKAYLVGKNKFDLSSLVPDMITYSVSGSTLTLSGTASRARVKYVPTYKAVGGKTVNLSFTIDSITNGGGAVFFGMLIKDTVTNALRYENGTGLQTTGKKVVTANLSANEIISRVDFNINDTASSLGDTRTYIISDIQLEVDSLSSYEPYKGQLYTLQLGQNVYGGTVDFISGVMTAEFAKGKVSDLDWSTPLSTQSTNIYRMRSKSLRSVILKPSTSSDLTDILSDSYGTKTGRQTWECIQGIALDSAGDVIIYDDDYNTSTSYTDFVSDMGNVEIIYPLATPITVQLTPTQIEALVGANTITCPLTGQSITEADYREVMGYDSVKQSIEIKVSLSSLGTVEDSNLSSQAYSSGDYFVRNGQMCKATTAIAQGSTLTEGTNYTAYTLAEILKLIENA